MGTTSSREEVKEEDVEVNGRQGVIGVDDHGNDDDGTTTSAGGGDGGGDSNKAAVVCEYCDATKHQKELPKQQTEDASVCDVYYTNVDACMKRHNGQISKCQFEWKEFRDCFNTTKKQ